MLTILFFAVSGLCFAAEKQGLHLSVMEATVTAGSPVKLHWSITPDGQSSVSIVLGIVLPSGEMMQYLGPKRGFAPFQGIDAAAPIVTDFPFNFPISASMEIATSEGWPRGTCQFVAAVLDGKKLIEVVYSNSFTLQ
jgi:hypothetical protein